MDYSFWIGIVGSLVLVTGAAWHDPTRLKNPIKSKKDWLFLIGSFIMLLFALIGYYNNG